MKRFGFFMAAATMISLGISTTSSHTAQAACTPMIPAKNVQSGNCNFSDNCFSGNNICNSLNSLFNNSGSYFFQNPCDNNFNCNNNFNCDSNFNFDSSYNDEDFFPGQRPGQNSPSQYFPGQYRPTPGRPSQNQPGQTAPDSNKPNQNTPDSNKPNQSTPNSNKPNQSTPDNNKPNQNTPDNNKPNQNTPDNTNTNNAYVQQVIRLVNEERAKAGLTPLNESSSVSDAAYIRAKEITQNFSHTRPNGSSFSTILQQKGISFSASGENIAYGQKTPQEVMNTWMNSSGHRANILNSNYTSIGVGCYQAANGTLYWTQLFTR